MEGGRAEPPGARSGVLVLHEQQRVVAGPGGAGRVGLPPERFEALRRLAERHAPPGTFRLERGGLRVGSFVGYLRGGGLRVELLPKLPLAAPEGGDPALRARRARALLVHLLGEALGARWLEAEAAPLLHRPGAVHLVLLRRLVQESRELLRRGLPRAYEPVEGRLGALRGRLLLQRQLREGLRHPERLHCRYDRFSADGPVGRLLRAALEQVRRLAPTERLRRESEAVLGPLRELAGPLTEPPARALDRVGRDRQGAPARPALELAALVLLGLQPVPRGGSRPLPALLFDMNELFERYVLRQLRRLPGLRVQGQQGRTFWTAEDGGRQLARPDVVADLPGGATVVLDTKWKLPEEASAGRPRASDADLRQLYAYQRLFGAERAVLLYPRAHAGQRPVRGRFHDGGLAELAFLELLPGGRPDGPRVRAALAGLLGLEEAGSMGATG